MSPTVPIGAPHSCLLKDSGATAPTHSPIPWIKLTLGQHQHIMNYGHLPPQTHCSLWSNVRNIEGFGKLGLLTAYSLSYLLCCVCFWEVGGGTTLGCRGVERPIGLRYLSCIPTFALEVETGEEVVFACASYCSRTKAELNLSNKIKVNSVPSYTNVFVVYPTAHMIWWRKNTDPGSGPGPFVFRISACPQSLNQPNQ